MPSVYVSSSVPNINDWIPISRYLNNALAGRERQAHQAGAIYGHDLVPDIQLP